MQEPTANAADRIPTALLAVPNPVNCANTVACAKSGKLLGPDHWSADDWQAFFDKRAVAEFGDGLPRAQAETQALAHCCRRMAEPQPGTISRRGAASAAVVGTMAMIHPSLLASSQLAAWLHSSCWPNWLANRQAEAVAALRAMGIASPAENLNQ
jgi:hypothetical protein